MNRIENHKSDTNGTDYDDIDEPDFDDASPPRPNRAHPHRNTNHMHRVYIGEHNLNHTTTVRENYAHYHRLHRMHTDLNRTHDADEHDFNDIYTVCDNYLHPNPTKPPA